MLTLRISHAAGQVEAVLEGDGALLGDKRPFSFTLFPQEAEDIRWYLEDYRVYRVEPRQKHAKRIEGRMSEIGRELFSSVLGEGKIWERVRNRLGDTRIEIETNLEDALVPWELLRDPVADLPLALAVSSFVRFHSGPAVRSNLEEPARGRIRILLAICRLEDDSVPFRSVARHLIRGLAGAASKPFDLEVLRPPTFEQLAKRLRTAKMQGQPFHVVHFDGHGSSGEVFFENPKNSGNSQPVKAVDLGKLLHETGVPLLILNACKSAGSEPPDQPIDTTKLHEQVRQFGSFAHAVMDCGASGVFAWRYNVFVDTAAQCMADLYGALCLGVPLGEAATLARKQLRSAARNIEDWSVPVVFEARPVCLFPRSTGEFVIKLQASSPTDSALPQAPDMGFIGRDETILQLDRKFDEQNVVLLHAYAGSGKSSTAVEFAEWYGQTGGILGRILFTSFEQYKGLPEVLGQLGRVVEGALAKNQIQWLTLDDAQRRDVALQVMGQIPVFWIWDNVELIAGFPVGAPSPWSQDEQNELADFLRAARSTKAKFLLTSRRAERGWLHDLPARIELPPMPFAERVQMAAELARKLGRRLEDVEDWRPLLRFTQGNPLTLTVVVGQALRDGLRSREEIENFTRMLQAGEEAFEDEVTQGRTRSLAASLTYGFENAFDEAERRHLAVLHLFQGFVGVGVLQRMGSSEDEWCLPDLKNLTREESVAVLDRAAEVGVLKAFGRGFYSIHPAVPWFFHRLFEQSYPGRRAAVTRAFAEAVGALGSYLHRQYEQGNRSVIASLMAEEGNLRFARSLAQSGGWLHAVIGTMQGLLCLCQHTGQSMVWARLVKEIIPDFVDSSTDGPLTGKEVYWSLVTQYRVRLHREAKCLDDAERLQGVRVDWNRKSAALALAKPPRDLDAAERSSVLSLVALLLELVDIQRERGSAGCVEGFREALSLAEGFDTAQLSPALAFNLGRGYEGLDAIRDLAQAERWYGQSLDLCAKEDRLGRARCLIQLGNVAYRRAGDAAKATRAPEFVGQLENAERYTKKALELLPGSAIEDLRAAHYQMGLICSLAGQSVSALHHFQEAIRHCEMMQDRFKAGRARSGAARALAVARRFAEAREWAQAALRDFQASENADQDVVETLRLLQKIESDPRETSPPS